MNGVGNATVHRYFQADGAKFLHRRKVQAMRPDHELKRVEFAKWSLKQYGRKLDGNTVWDRLVKTDFTAMTKKNGTLNTRNDADLEPQCC